jgi:DNA invertase Pin-like site-specific DNA recombinase
VVTMLGAGDLGLVVLDQAIDTTTANGRLVFHIISALSEWEASMARERTVEGMQAARVRHGGRLPVRGPVITADQIRTATTMAASTDMSAARIAQVVGVSRATLYRHVDLGRIREKKASS